MKNRSLSFILALLMLFSIFTITPTTQANARVPVSRIDISRSIVNIAVGDTYQLLPNVQPSNASNRSVTYSTSNSGVASVTSGGLVTARGIGMSNITIRAVDGGLATSVVVHVRRAGTSGMQAAVSPGSGTIETVFVYAAITGTNAARVTMTFDNNGNRNETNLALVQTNATQRGWRTEMRYSGAGRAFTTITSYDSRNNVLDSRQLSVLLSLPPPPRRTVENGVYTLISAVNSSSVVDCWNSSTANGANVHLWQNLNTPNQQFNVTYLNNGYYRLDFRHSGRTLDVQGGSTAFGANVVQWPYQGSHNQQWEIRPTGFNGWYYLIARHSHLFLDVAGGRSANGTNIITFPGNRSHAQMFWFQRVAVQQEVRAWVRTAGAPLNVRSGPGTNHSIVGQFSNSQEIVVTNRTLTNGFFPVRSIDRRIIGWSSAEFITFEQARGPVWPVGGNGGIDQRNWPRYNTRNEYHSGTDISAARGTPVFSAYCGTVDTVANLGNTSYGRYVIIRSVINGNVRFIYYAHLDRNDFVRPGQTVTAGQQIGTVGSTGNSTGPHLHYEVRNQDKRFGSLSSPGLNPHHYLPRR
jgi:uncharacterized protein YraI